MVIEGILIQGAFPYRVVIEELGIEVKAFTPEECRENLQRAITDLLKTQFPNEEIDASAHFYGSTFIEFCIRFKEPKYLAALMLTCQRKLAGKTLKDVAKKRGTTENAIRQLEKAERDPSIGTIERHLKAISPNLELVIKIKSRPEFKSA